MGKKFILMLCLPFHAFNIYCAYDIYIISSNIWEKSVGHRNCYIGCQLYIRNRLFCLTHIYIKSCYGNVWPLSFNFRTQGRQRREKKISFWKFLDKIGRVSCEAISWDEQVLCSCPLERISVKLKCLIRALQSWSQKKIGNINTVGPCPTHPPCRGNGTRPPWLWDDENWLKDELKWHCFVLASLERR